jgi:hypothetical protein
MNSMDFTLLPPIEGADIFVRLHPAIENRFEQLSALDEVFDRARTAVLFFCEMQGTDPRWKSEAYLRAGLNEFYAMEAAATRDFRHAQLKATPPQIRDSHNPLLHLMLLLRNSNVHTRPNRGRTASINVESRVGEPHAFTYTGVLIDALTAADLLKRRGDAKRYQASDIRQLVDWVMDKQKVFGIGEVFRAGVNGYCKEILDAVP